MQQLKSLGIKGVFFLVFFTAPVTVPEAFSQSLQPLDSAEAHTLDEIVIQSQLKNIRLSSATPVQILSGEELERLNSLSVADALRFFSGVQLKDYGGIGGLKTINVRSMGSHHTAVFYDGLQIINAQNGQVDLAKFSLDNIEAVELYNGQKADLLQSASAYSSSSTLFLKTKEADFSDGRPLHTSYYLKGGSFGLINPSAVLHYKISDDLNATFSTSFSNANGKYKFNYTNGIYDTTAVRSNGDVLSWRLEAGLGGKLTKKGNWNLKVYDYQSKRGLPGAVVGNRFDYHQRMWEKNFFVQGTMSQQISDRYSLLLHTKYSDNFMRYLDPEITQTEGFLENIYKEKEAYFSVANKHRLTKIVDLALSADYRFNNMYANLTRFSYPRRNTVLLAAAAQLNTTRLNLQVNALETIVSESVENGLQPEDKQEFTPSVLASWQPFSEKDFRIRAFYKSIFRLPTFNDMYFMEVGNRFLKPESTEQYNLGLIYVKVFPQKHLNKIEIQADVYHNKVKNKIIAQPKASSGIWLMRNLGLVDIKGAELNFKSGWQLANNIAVTASLAYTCQKAVDVTDSSSEFYGDQIPYIPLHSGSFISGIDYKNYGANYSFIYTGERFNQAAESIYNYVRPWYTHDLAFFWKHPVGTNILKVTFEVNNVLNQYYDVIENFPMPGRNYRLTLAYKI